MKLLLRVLAVLLVLVALFFGGVLALVFSSGNDLRWAVVLLYMAITAGSLVGAVALWRTASRRGRTA